MAKRRFANKNAENPNTEGEEVLVEAVEGQAQQASDWFEENQKTIVGGLLGLAILIGLYFAYQNLIRKPAMTEAASAMYQAQYQFERDSFSAALTNPGGGHPGLLQIISDYGSTPAGNTANYYAGVSYLHLGDFNKAIEYLDDFSAKGEVMPIMKSGSLGDAYSELGDFGKAISYYEKATNSDNEFLTSQYLKKLGMLYEKQQDFNKALASYEKIKTKYPTSAAGVEVDKYIGRVSAVAK
jgi:tetratricopeptide (TPR) repeat protein